MPASPSLRIIWFVAAVSSPEEQEVEYDGAVSAEGLTHQIVSDGWNEAEVSAQHIPRLHARFEPISAEKFPLSAPRC